MRLIKSIEIRHFRSIHRQSIENLRSLNVFAGKNDSGKSNVLRALNLFFNGQSSFLEPFNFVQDFSKLALLEARDKKKGKQFISIRLVLDENAIQGKGELKRLAKSNGGLWVTREWWAYGGTYKEKLPEFIEQASQGVKRSFSVLISSIRFIYIPAFKSSDVFSRVLSMVASEEGLFINQTAKDELNRQITSSAADLATDFSNLTSINTKVSLPITLDSFWSSLQVATDFKKSLEKPLERGVADDYLIGLVARGEGIKSIFTPVILGWLAKHNRQRYFIWGIDEPENSLESSKTVALFRKFIEYSKFAQIFASTHSPVFMFPEAGEHLKRTATYIAHQDKEGDSVFRSIDLTLPELKRSLLHDFGVDYGTFLVMQENYAKQLQLAERELEDIRKKVEVIQRPVVFVEGETDEKYMKKAIDVLRDGEFVADITWIGRTDEHGQSKFGGDTALDKCKEFLKSNPGFSRGKVVLLYDVDCARKREETESLLVLSPDKIEDAPYRTGVEHLLVLPADFQQEDFQVEETKFNGDKTTTVKSVDKRRLCEHLCNNTELETQKSVFGRINELLSDLQIFIDKPRAASGT